MTDDRFPFGQPSTLRPARQPDKLPAKAFVLGVYPSAFHVRWRLPAWFVEETGEVRATVGSLAVDVEPTVFWDGGTSDDQQSLLASWLQASEFRAGDELGTWGHVGLGANNGSSGSQVTRDVLMPLDVDPSTVWFDDALPRFFVKRSASGSTTRQQGDVIDGDYERVRGALAAHDLPAPRRASLPSRPTPKSLVSTAVAEHAPRLRAAIEASGASVLVTLGKESLGVMARIADTGAVIDAPALRPDLAYGVPGHVVIAGRMLHWFGLAHPGLRAQGAWTAARERWAEQARGGTWAALFS